MENIINKIQSIFQKFNTLQFEIHAKTNKVKFEEIDFLYYEAVNEVKQLLQNIYLQGNNLTLIRVRKELLRIKMLLSEDFNTSIMMYDENGNMLGIVEAKDIANDYKLKLDFVNQLISFLDNYLPPDETEHETPTFKNNFDNISPVEIHKHFKAGLVEKGYLTEQELNEYLKAAFELKKKPETLFKFKYTPTKQKIYTVFYVYYKDISQKKHDKQKEYAALLGDYFEGYKTETIQTNWAREYKTKR